MRLHKYLARSLSKVHDLGLNGMHFLLVLNLVPIHAILVRQIIETIQVLNSLLPPLLIPEHQIDPIVDTV